MKLTIEELASRELDRIGASSEVRSVWFADDSMEAVSH
jgi:hypothetical protein